ncbi:MAG: hypothetical protein ACQEQA_02675 [Bacillota bacterium]
MTKRPDGAVNPASPFENITAEMEAIPVSRVKGRELGNRKKGGTAD